MVNLTISCFCCDEFHESLKIRFLDKIIISQKQIEEMSEVGACNVCLNKWGKSLDVRWVEFLQTFGLNSETIYLCKLCNTILIKMEKFIMSLKRYEELEEIEIYNSTDIQPFRLTINKLESVDIPPTFSEIYIQEDMGDDLQQEVSVGIDDLDYSIEESKGDNVSETNAFKMNFEVTYLSLEEQKSEILFKKKSVKFKNMLYQCEKCGIGFVSHDAFKDHNLRHDNDTAIHVCPICHLHFKSQLVLSQHKLSHKRRFKCVLCGEAFKRWAHALVHRSHCGTEPVVAACEVCNKIFDNQYSLNVHKKIHSRKDKYICDVCSKNFGTKQHLIIHLRIHSGAKPFRCTKCDKTFTTHSNLKSHKIVHSDEKSFYCVECNKNFKSDKSLKRHLASSAKHVGGEKIYSCLDCLKLFTSAISLSSHRKNVHLSSFKCHICDKIFSNSSNLKKHLKSIHIKS